MSNKITKRELEEIRKKETPAKEYTNGEVTVFWKPKLCIHSANCLLGLPEVFDNSKKPWIDIHGATTEDIIKTVNTCPTRALTFLKNEPDEKPAEEQTMERTGKAGRIQIQKDGPALISGDFVLVDENKKPIPVTTKIISICRCGASKKKPFCDGTHRTIGFKG